MRHKPDFTETSCWAIAFRGCSWVPLGRRLLWFVSSIGMNPEIYATNTSGLVHSMTQAAPTGVPLASSPPSSPSSGEVSTNLRAPLDNILFRGSYGFRFLLVQWTVLNERTSEMEKSLSTEISWSCVSSSGLSLTEFLWQSAMNLKLS